MTKSGLILQKGETDCSLYDGNTVKRISIEEGEALPLVKNRILTDMAGNIYIVAGKDKEREMNILQSWQLKCFLIISGKDYSAWYDGYRCAFPHYLWNEKDEAYDVNTLKG